MNRSKIEWTDYTWNPVTGCLHDCDYCYARRIAERFQKMKQPPGGGICMDSAEPFPYGFMPTFYSYRLHEPAALKRPSKIFVCSMADLFGKWVPDRWINSILRIVSMLPEHTFQFLTKNPGRLTDFIFPNNCWVGATATDPQQWRRALAALPDVAGQSPGVKTFVSCEPLLQEIDPVHIDWLDWLIVGAMTGPGAKTHTPNPRWILNLTQAASAAQVPFWLKDNLPYGFNHGAQDWPRTDNGVI